MTEFFIGRTKVGRNSDKNFSSEYSDQVRRNELPLAKILMLPINHKTQISSNTITIYVVLSSETEIGRVSTYRSTGVIGFNYVDKLAKTISSIEFKVHCKKLNCFKGIGRGVVWVWGCKKGWMGVETRWGCQQWGWGWGWGCQQCSVRSAPPQKLRLLLKPAVNGIRENIFRKKYKSPFKGYLASTILQNTSLTLWRRWQWWIWSVIEIISGTGDLSWSGCNVVLSAEQWQGGRGMLLYLFFIGPRSDLSLPMSVTD